MLSLFGVVSGVPWLPQVASAIQSNGHQAWEGELLGCQLGLKQAPQD
jgi:hypothetical protein